MALKVAGRGPQVLAIYAVFAAITTVAMVLRVYTRVRLVKKFGLDDWLALTAWASTCSALYNEETNICRPPSYPAAHSLLQEHITALASTYGRSFH